VFSQLREAIVLTVSDVTGEEKVAGDTKNSLIQIGGFLSLLEAFERNVPHGPADVEGDKGQLLTEAIDQCSSSSTLIGSIVPSKVIDALGGRAEVIKKFIDCVMSGAGHFDGSSDVKVAIALVLMSFESGSAAIVFSTSVALNVSSGLTEVGSRVILVYST